MRTYVALNMMVLTSGCLFSLLGFVVNSTSVGVLPKSRSCNNMFKIKLFEATPWGEITIKGAKTFIDCM
jgi:hypothetical protein